MSNVVFYDDEVDVKRVFAKVEIPNDLPLSDKRFNDYICEELKRKILRDLEKAGVFKVQKTSKGANTEYKIELIIVVRKEDVQ